MEYLSEEYNCICEEYMYEYKPSVILYTIYDMNNKVWNVYDLKVCDPPTASGVMCIILGHVNGLSAGRAGSGALIKISNSQAKYNQILQILKLS